MTFTVLRMYNIVFMWRKVLLYVACAAFDLAVGLQIWDLHGLIPLKAKDVTANGLFATLHLSPHLPGTLLVIQSATRETSFETLHLWPFSACQQSTWPEMLKGKAEQMASVWPSGITWQNAMGRDGSCYHLSS